MSNTREFKRIAVLGLVALIVLSGCRPASEENEVDPADKPGVVDLPPSPTPLSVAGEPADQPSIQELMAQIPTPGPDAIVPTPASLRPDEMTARGSANAPITVVEFSDYQCPYCLNYTRDTYPSIIRNYVETGQVRYVFKDFPLEQIHPQAIPAALAARCAGEQGAYWGMHDQLFDAQASWGGQEDPVPVFVDLGAALGLDTNALQACLDSDRYREVVMANLAEGIALGVTGTPTFFINGYPLVGARPFELFELAFALATSDRLGDAYAQAPTPTPMPADQIPTGGSPTLGSAEAPVVMIEYSDYQCPYCGRYAAETFPRLKADYIDAGLVRYVFKDFPLSFHQQASLAAQAARCAGDQGDYWGMHALLFTNQAAWSSEAAVQVWRGFAEELGLDGPAFSTCLESGVHAQAVEGDLREGMSLGVSGTPAFFVGDRFVSGAQPYEVFQGAIEAALGR